MSKKNIPSPPIILQTFLFYDGGFFPSSVSRVYIRFECQALESVQDILTGNKMLLSFQPSLSTNRMLFVQPALKDLYSFYFHYLQT